MEFKKILQFMKRGYKVKLPSWGGYWELKDNKIVMHTKDGTVLNDCTERLFYTIENVLSDEWIVANEGNTPALGGEALISFGSAVKYIKRGFKLTRKVWEKRGDGRHLHSYLPEVNQQPQHYIYLIKGHTPELYYPTQEDMLAEDWYIIEEDYR